MAFEVGDKVKYEYGGHGRPYSMEGEVVAVTKRMVKVLILSGRTLSFTKSGVEWGFGEGYYLPCIRKIEKEIGTTTDQGAI